MQLADRLWQCNPSQLVAAVAAELTDEENEVVAAILAKKRSISKQ